MTDKIEEKLKNLEDKWATAVNVHNYYERTAITTLIKALRRYRDALEETEFFLSSADKVTDYRAYKQQALEIRQAEQEVEEILGVQG